MIHIRATLRAALTQAERWGLVPRNVAALVEAAPAEQREQLMLTAEQARAFLDTLDGERLEALYAVALALGAAPGGSARPPLGGH